MTSQTPRIDFYAPKTLAVMDQAFAAIWNVLKADDPFRDYAKDGELRIAVGQTLLNLVADGVTDPGRLRQLTVESLLPGHWRAEISGRPPLIRTDLKVRRKPPNLGVIEAQWLGSRDKLLKPISAQLGDIRYAFAANTISA